MSERELLTVKEFAEREKISRQAVYKKLSTSLQPFCQQVDNVVYIDYTAYLSQKPAEAVNPLTTPLSTSVNPDSTVEVDRLTAENSRLTGQIEALTGEIAALRSDLAAERTARQEDARAAFDLIAAEGERYTGQIDRLTSLLEAERQERLNDAAHLKELTGALTEALTRAQALQHEAQQLHALTAASGSPPPAAEDGDQTGNQQAPATRSIWKRIFKRPSDD